MPVEVLLTALGRKSAQWAALRESNLEDMIRLAAKQVSAGGQALRVSFPSVMSFFLGFEAGRFQLCVPVMS